MEIGPITSLLVLLFISKIHCQSQINFSLILHYLEEFDAKFYYFLTCWDKQKTRELSHLMTKKQIRYSFLKAQENVNVAFTEKESMTSYGYVLDLPCQNFNYSFLFENISPYTKRLTHPWLILTDSSNFTISCWADFFHSFKPRMDSNIKLIVPQTRETFEIFDVYNPAPQTGQNPILTKSDFRNGSKMISYKNLSSYLQRKDMSSILLRSGSVVLVENYRGTFEEYMLDATHTQFDTMSKFHYPIFLLLKDIHNFSHTVQIEDKWFGNYQNGTDGGVGKLLYENKIDITCTGASQRPPRVDAYDYLMPSYHFRPCYIFRNPGSYDPLSNEFLKPFSTAVWYCVALSAILVASSLKLFYKVEKKFEGYKSMYSWVTAMLTTLSVIFQQDASSFPTGYAGRIAFLVLQILSILLYNYYTSSIISSLLSKPPEAFHTLDELGRSNLEIGIENLPYTITWFEIMNDSDVQYIYKNKVLKSERLNIYEAEEGIAKVREGGFAYHTQLDTGYPIIARTFDQDAICDITEIPMIPQVEAGMMVQKKSQYKELFHVSLRRIKEVGLIRRISMIWEAKKPNCMSSARVISVGFNQVFVAFLTLFTGILLALVLLVAEIMWFKFDFDAKFR